MRACRIDATGGLCHGVTPGCGARIVQAGMNCEHSWADAPVIGHLWEYMLYLGVRRALTCCI
jgi:hypothetical protein